MIRTNILRFSLFWSSYIGAVLAAPPTGPGSDLASLITGPELIVVLHSAAKVRRDEPPAPAPPPNSILLDILKRHKAAIAPVFQPVNTSDFILKARDVSKLPDLSVYYKVDAPADQLETVQKEIVESGQVSGAYIRKATSLPRVSTRMGQKASKRQVGPTPNFQDHQGYLNAAPEGINAAFGNSQSGGLGDGIRIVDVEQGFNFQHEDLVQIQGGLIFGIPNPVNDHGTAVNGIIGGDNNNFGVLGIAPNAVLFGSSYWSWTVAAAVYAAIAILNPGDIILIEGQVMGPNGNWIPVEWFPDTWAAIKVATASGIIVVEAAGNGNQNLDDPVFDQGWDTFPSTWFNPLNPSNPSSGAVIVGAGAPPPGSNGVDYGPDRSRLDFSNYGSRIDAQGWGRAVTSTGYGDLYNGGPDALYTDHFSGTSSASPIVTGALAIVLGILKNLGKRINSEQARDILRATGSPQQDGLNGPVSERIGNRPDLVQLIPAAKAIASF